MAFKDLKNIFPDQETSIKYSKFNSVLITLIAIIVVFKVINYFSIYLNITDPEATLNVSENIKSGALAVAFIINTAFILLLLFIIKGLRKRVASVYVGLIVIVLIDLSQISNTIDFAISVVIISLSYFIFKKQFPNTSLTGSPIIAKDGISTNILK